MAYVTAPSSSHAPKTTRKFCEKWRYNDEGVPRTWLEFKEAVMFCSVSSQRKGQAQREFLCCLLYNHESGE
ncbi:Hypothetical protein SMAX5B_007160 [Scophthalmus maximus]|uniref:Uncharacterized protein n=1 Tax=Scophthalmus maximus TaxID=52904 RepID=A0A2U9BUT7_SCOMX|nr:Hypothetical protein SMAX5B_007160 [Scophthalmus maximus]